MAATTVQAATQTVGAGSQTNLGPNTTDGNTIKLYVRTASTGVFVGDSGVSGATNGFELAANKDYEFTIRPGAGSSTSADYGLNVKNTNGSSVAVSWIATLA